VALRSWKVLGLVKRSSSSQLSAAICAGVRARANNARATGSVNSSKVRIEMMQASSCLKVDV